MRHRKDGRKFGKNTAHRRAMFRNLATNLVNHERLVTTEAKAKELRRVADRLITKAKRLGPVAYTPQADLNDGDKAKRLHVKRGLAAFLHRWGVARDGETKRDLVEKVLVELSQRFKERPGGYTRIIKLGPRRGDGASMSVIEFVDAEMPEGLVDSADDGAAASEPKEAAAEPKEAAADAKEEAEDESTTASDDGDGAEKA